jgi:hypothetical protein
MIKLQFVITREGFLENPSVMVTKSQELNYQEKRKTERISQRELNQSFLNDINQKKTCAPLTL